MIHKRDIKSDTLPTKPIFHPLQIDKVHYISEIKALPSAECRNAELALFSYQPQQAESIYLQAGLVYRAIQLNIDLFNWKRLVH